MNLKNQPTLDLASAQRILASAVARARELNLRVSVCVVDAGGHILTMARMDGAPYQTTTLASDKAYTSAGFGVTTAAFFDRISDDPPLARSVPTAVHRMAAIGGGAPITSNESVVGAVGVSGSHWTTDDEVARAAADSLHADVLSDQAQD